MSIVVIFAVHHVKILHKTLLEVVQELLLRRVGVDRRALLPVKFGLLIVESVVPLTVRWSFVNVLELILILLLTVLLIEELFELCVILVIALAKSNMGPVIPGRAKEKFQFRRVKSEIVSR